MRRVIVMAVATSLAACASQQAAVQNNDTAAPGTRGNPLPSPTSPPAEIDLPPSIIPGQEGPGAPRPSPTSPPAEVDPPPVVTPGEEGPGAKPPTRESRP